MVVQSHRPLIVPKGGSQAVSVPSNTPMADIVARRIPIGLECVSVPLFLDPRLERSKQRNSQCRYDGHPKPRVLLGALLWVYLRMNPVAGTSWKELIEGGEDAVL